MRTLAALVSALQHRRPSSGIAVNPRSVTTKSTANGAALFCKTSDLSLAREAEVLRCEACQETGLVQAVPFVRYDGQRNELVTEYKAGDNLFNVMWNGTARMAGGRHQANLVALLAGVASWLARFHVRSRGYVATAVEPACSAARVEAAVNRKLDRLAAMLAPRHRNAAFIARLRRQAHAASSAPGWEALPMSLIHGDFSAGNVLVALDGQAFVVDFADARPGFTLEDVVRFWTSIWELAQCGGRRRAVFEPLLPEILTRNGYPASIALSPPFRLMREWNSVTRLLEVRSLRGRLGARTMLVLLRLARVHRRWLEDLAAEGVE